jgi:iron complex transport system ATP-binding protein
MARDPHALEAGTVTVLLTARGIALPRRLEPTDLTIETPGMVCIVGPNGSGKTSLLHALAGIGKPAGEVRIDGADPAKLNSSDRRRALAFLPAGRDVAWPVTGRDLIALGGPADDLLLADLGLGPLADRRIDRLSTGERSRVLIARALAQRSRVLFLDEPAANLDPAWQLRLLALLRIGAKSAAVVAAMHDLDLAARFSDRLVVMDDRRIAADGDPADILAGPVLAEVFGVKRSAEGWRLLSPSVDPRSSP